MAMTSVKANKIIDFIKKEYFTKDVEIELNFITGKFFYLINGYTWSVDCIDKNNFVINITKDYADKKLFFKHDKEAQKNAEKTLSNFESYIKKEFNFDNDFINKYTKDVIRILSLLHELNHALCINRSKLSYEKYMKKVSKQYMIFERKCQTKKDFNITYEYRKIQFEYLADKGAIDMFNKHAIKLLSIMTNKSQKQLKKEFKIN